MALVDRVAAVIEQIFLDEVSASQGTGVFKKESNIFRVTLAQCVSKNEIIPMRLLLKYLF